MSSLEREVNIYDHTILSYVLSNQQQYTAITSKLVANRCPVTSKSTGCLTVFAGWQQRKYKFLITDWKIYWWSVDGHHKGPHMLKMSLCYDNITHCHRWWQRHVAYYGMLLSLIITLVPMSDDEWCATVIFYSWFAGSRHIVYLESY